METKVYTKNDILQKLAQDGFFVDYLTLNSFLDKYKIEAIFEDENGNEFFDKSAYDILVRNVLKRATDDFGVQDNLPPANQVNTNTLQMSDENLASSSAQESSQVVSELALQDKPEVQETVQTQQKDEKSASLENIKWYRWDDVSADLASYKIGEDVEIVDADKDLSHEPEQKGDNNEDTLEFETFSNEAKTQTQENYWGNVDSELSQQQDETSNHKNEINNELSTVISSSDENEDDFDDIGLLSDSIQAQEKFQSYIVNELAKKNIDVTPPKQENAFKFDISEKTLNMIARAIAKKIAKQVSTVLSSGEKNNAKLLQIEKKSQLLEQKVATLEEQNKKLKLLLAESNKNLNSYKPTFFGFYRFVKRKKK